MAEPINQPKQRQMQEVKAPELFQFTKPGQILEGVLVSIEPVTVKGKQALEYMFEQPENKTRMSCLGTADLNKKIQPGFLGHWVTIRYENDQKLENQQASHSDMKIFKVLVGKDLETGYEHLQAA
jgi:hypothetical protein